MSRKSKSISKSDQWVAVSKYLQSQIPHFMAWSLDEEDFKELRLKIRDDGTVLAIAKGYGSDGGDVVCFGVGYDVVTALMAIDATIQGDNWRLDKPWKPGKGT